MNERMKKEAVKRLKRWGVLESTVKNFSENGIVNISEFGLIYPLNSNQKKVIKEFEEKNKTLVYHVVHAFTSIGELYVLLYVSPYEDEWAYDDAMQSENQAMAYVINVDVPEFSEYGSVGIKEQFGGLVRTW